MLLSEALSMYHMQTQVCCTTSLQLVVYCTAITLDTSAMQAYS